MSIFKTTMTLECEGHINNVVWNRCISEAVERYRAETGQDVRSVQFSVKGEEKVE